MTPMDFRHRTEETYAKIILVLGFLIPIFGVFLIDSIGLLREPSEPRDREVMALLRATPAPTMANLLDGGWANEVRRTLPEASLVGRELRSFYRSMTLGLMRETPPDVVLGRDGWLFYEPTIRPVKRNALEPLVPLIAEALQSGVKVSFVLVPSKVAIYPEMLPSAPPFPIVDRTEEILALCLRYGISSLDLRPLLTAAKASADEPLYHPTDTHTTTSGSLVIARALANQFVRTPPTDADRVVRDLLDRRSESVQTFPGDLHVMLDLPFGSWMSEPYFVPFRKPPSLTEIPTSGPADHLWLGDSFSRYHDAFLPRACALLACWPAVEFHSYTSGFESRLRERLSSSSPPRHLIICLASRWF